MSFQKIFGSEEEMNKCRDDIVTKDKEIHRIGFYFPKIQQAKKVQNMVLKPFALIIAFFRDVLPLPFNYQKLKSNLRENLPVYQYLKKEGFDTKSLNKDAFEIVFAWQKIDESSLEDCKGISKMEDKSVIDVNDGLKFIGPKKVVRNEIKENKIEGSNVYDKKDELGKIFSSLPIADFLGVKTFSF